MKAPCSIPMREGIRNFIPFERTLEIILQITLQNLIGWKSTGSEGVNTFGIKEILV